MDFTALDRIVRLGLAASGRVGTFRLQLEDVPGSLSRVDGLLAQKKANILDIRRHSAPARPLLQHVARGLDGPSGRL